MSPESGDTTTSPEIDPFTIEYALTPAELAATRRKLFRRTPAYRVLVAFATLAALGLVLAHNAGAGLLAAWVFGGFAYLLFVKARVDWRRHPEQRQSRRVSFSVDGVHVETTTTDATILWPGVRSIEHSGRIHYVFTARLAALPIPDRALRPEQHDALRRLASTR